MFGNGGILVLALSSFPVSHADIMQVILLCRVIQQFIPA